MGKLKVRFLSIFLLVLCAGCRGTSPEFGRVPDRGLCSVIIGARFVLSSGRTQSGKAWINLEGEGDHGDGETYRLAVDPGLPMIYQVEPDLYRLAPTRSVFGSPQETIKVLIEGRGYRASFPRELMRKASIAIKPGKLVSLGILEVRATAALPGRPSKLKVSLDDSVEARRQLVQEAIRAIMDPSAPYAYRENAIAWSRALELTLVGLASESETAPLFKRAGP